MATKGGRKVLKARRARGRWELAPTMNNHLKRINWKAKKAPVSRESTIKKKK
jgi:hypothetical protein